MQRIDHKKFMTSVLDFGEAMMGCGAEVSRVEDSVNRICTSYGYEHVQLMAISAGIVLTSVCAKLFVSAWKKRKN